MRFEVRARSLDGTAFFFAVVIAGAGDVARRRVRTTVAEAAAEVLVDGWEH